jgi:D-alanyl-D-alanine carboxypeptidase
VGRAGLRRVVPLGVLTALVAAGCAGAAGAPATGTGAGGASPPAAKAAPPGDPPPATAAAPTSDPPPPATAAAPAGGCAAGAAGRGASPAAARPRFRGTVAAIDRRTRARMRWSWRPGCPVGLVELRLLGVRHWGFDRKVHHGELVVHRDQARAVLRVLERLFQLRYPIRRLRLVDHYRADDDRSMAANNTSAFNCRRVSGTTRWSEHAYGRAIDLNPVQNPYVAGRHVSPPAGRPYANRTRRAPGMVHAGDAVVRAFAAAGWEWGGTWRSARDYQHFSATGR